MERSLVDQYARRVEEYRSALREMRMAFHTATEVTQHAPLADVTKQELFALLALAQSYRPDGPATAAIYALAQLTYRLERLLEPWGTIAEYHAMQEKLRLMEEA